VPIRSVTLRILGESKDALAKMKVVNEEADKLEKRRVMVHVGVDLDKASVTKVKADLTALSKFKTDIPLKFNIEGLTEALAKIKTELAAIRAFVKQNPVDLNIGSGGAGLAAMIRTLHNNFDMLSHDLVTLRQQTDTTNARLGELVTGFSRVRSGLTSTAKEVETTGNRVGKMFTRGQGWGWLSLFTGKVALFGGLATIGGLHLLADAIIEVLAVWIPATVAATAFGIAASDAVVAVVRHMTNLHTVMDATGKTIPPMTGHLEQLHKAVQPAVYQLFGDALTVMNDRTGLFATLAKGAATVLTQLGARMTVALTAGKGFGQFMSNAIPDLAKITDGFASLFGIIGNILHVVPGYAEYLLTFGTAFLKLAEYVSRVAEPFIGLGLAVHGFFVWAGLGATVAWALGKAIIFLGNTALGMAIKNIGIFLFTLGQIVIEFGLAEGAAFAFAGVMEAISAVNPLLWVGAAIGGLAALVVWLSRSETAAQKWGDVLQKNIDNSATVGQGITRLNEAVQQSAIRLTQAQRKLADTQKYTTEVNLHTGIQTKVVSAAYREQAQAVQDAQGQYTRFDQELQFTTGRMNGLAKAYGGQKNAMALVNAAGITEQEMQDKSAEGWAIITTQINSTIRGYKAMGQTGGTLGNDLSVLDRFVQDNYTAMQKLNQAWQQFTSDMTGTQSAFDTTAQGLQTLKTDMAATGKNAVTVRTSIGGLKDAFTFSHAAIDGLTKSDIALNQAFTEQIGNTSNLIATWRTAGISSNLFTTGVKDSIAPLLRYARGSQEATAQLIGLAEQAGYKGPIAMKNLVKWLGNTHDATAKVKAITNQATTQEALLSGAMEAQGTYIANTLIRDIQMAEMAYFGVTAKAKAYGTAIAQYGRNSVEAKTKADALIKSIIETGTRAHQSTGDMAALISKILHIPLSRAISIVEKGVGSFTISGQGGIFGGNKSNPSNTGLFHLRPAARGAYINTGTTPTADDVLLRASKGELVVPTRLVNAGAVDHLRGLIPGFAAGGIIRQGDLGVISGQSSQNYDYDFQAVFTTAMVKAMQSATKSAISAAQSSMFGGSNALGGDAAANERLARSMFPWPASMWPSFVYLEMREAGFNRFARNPTSGAYGIPQALPPTKMPFAAQAAGGSHAGAQLGWMFGYIRDVYGNPVNAANHERAVSWYGGGLKNGVFNTPTLIGVGDVPEVVNVRPLGGGRGGGGGDVYYITVQGDSDPDGAARRIVQNLRKYKQRHGNAALGIG